jgi:hypothetical protein
MSLSGPFFCPVGRVALSAAAIISAAVPLACAAQEQGSQRTTDSCRYLTADEAVPYVGPLISPPYRVGFDSLVPNAKGEACLYRGRDGREVLFQHSAGGARAVGESTRRIPTVADRMLHNADPSSVPAGANPAGGATAVMGSAGPGPWDNSNWFPTGTLVAYKNDDAIYVDVSGASGGKAAAIDLGTRAIGRMMQPLKYDGAAAVAQAPKPVKPVPPCDLVPRARAEAILGPLASDPAPDPDGSSCTYVVGSPDGRISYQLGITWTGGYKELNQLKHSTSVVAGLAGSTEGGQSIPGLASRNAQGGSMPTMPQLDEKSQKIMNGFTKAVGLPGMGAAAQRGMATDTTLTGPWDAGALINGSWLVVTKHDVGLAMVLGSADYDKAKALMAAACERL